MSGAGPSGLEVAEFGEVGEARANFDRMVKGMTRLKEISGNVAGGQLNVEMYVKEFSVVCTEMSRATGCMFEQEHLRCINMVATARNGGTGGGGGSFRYPRSIMENTIIQNLRVVSGDKSMLRRWRFPEGFPNGLLEGFPEGGPEDLSQGVPEGLRPEGFQAGSRVLRGLPEGIMEGLSKGFPEGGFLVSFPTCFPEGFPEGVL
jgi:hypothetical protein